MKYKATCTFAGKVSMRRGESREIPDAVAKPLLRCGYLEKVRENTKKDSSAESDQEEVSTVESDPEEVSTVKSDPEEVSGDESERDRSVVDSELHTGGTGKSDGGGSDAN